MLRSLIMSGTLSYILAMARLFCCASFAALQLSFFLVVVAVVASIVIVVAAVVWCFWPKYLRLLRATAMCHFGHLFLTNPQSTGPDSRALSKCFMPMLPARCTPPSLSHSFFPSLSLPPPLCVFNRKRAALATKQKVANEKN